MTGAPRQWRRSSMALASALLAQQAALAQELPAATLASVEIIGSAPLPGLGIDRKLLPYTVQTANSATIRKAGGDNLGEFMARNLNGVNVNEVSGSPFQNDITFRGYRASPVLGTAQGISVYLDGVRVNEPFGDVINWDMVPEAAIGNLLLVPGSNPLFGLNSLGGALALTTKSGLSHPGTEAELSVGSAGRRRADLAHGASSAGGWHSFIGATLFHDAGWREHSEGQLGNVLLKVGRTSEATDWSAAFIAGRSRLLGNGLLTPSLYQDNRRTTYTFSDITHNRLMQATLNLDHRFDAQTELSAVAYARNSRRDTVNGDIGEAYDDYVQDCKVGFDADGQPADPQACSLTRAQGAALHAGVLNTTSTRQDSQGLSANLSARRGPHRLDAGITFDRSTVAFDQFEQDAFITAERGVVGDPEEQRALSSSVIGGSRAYGLYLADTWSLSAATHLTASARMNHARVNNTLSNEGGPQAPERFTYSRLNPSLGMVHMAGGGLTLFGNIAQGNRVPTVIELGCADPGNPCRLPVGLQSDPYLKQVVARTLEVGARWQERDASVSASLYRIVNRDDILFLSSGSSRHGYFSNFERTRHQGADLSATRQFGPLGVRLAYSYLEAAYDADGELFTGARTVQVGRGTRIAGMPRHTLKLGLDWKVTPELNLGADAQAMSNLVTQGNEDGLTEDAQDGQAARREDWRIRGHALLNLRASFRPWPKWEFYVRVNNALDRRYETFGAIAPDLFPHGEQLKPHEGPVDAANVRFIAPGAPRSVVAGIRYSF